MTNPRWLKDLGVSNMSAVSALLFVTLKETHYHSNHTHTHTHVFPLRGNAVISLQMVEFGD